jgi:dethiobiotin synthetase
MAGFRLLPFKPSETGCGGARPADALLLRRASFRPTLPLDLICPYPFSLPLAPAAAAAQAGVRLRPRDLATAARRLAAVDPSACLLVETAGGLLSPFAPRFTGADLARTLRLPVLLVAANRLGTISHTVLCVREIRRRRLPLLGVVLVDTTPHDAPDRNGNAALIESLARVRLLGRVPYLRQRSASAIARALSRALDVPALLSASAVARPAVNRAKAS